MSRAGGWCGLAVLAVLLIPMGGTPAYEPPRLGDGRPDLHGVWTNASITRLERPDGVKSLVLSAEEAARMERFASAAMARGNRPTDPEAGAPTDGNSAAGYNSFWVDPGTKVGLVKGEFRSSWIIDPPTGKIPFKVGARAGNFRAFGGGRRMDGPEQRPLGERCLIGFGNTGGPGMLNVLYNNHYQIVQTKDHVMILVEMNHDARIIPIGGKHRPAAMFQWLGDSIGRWEGDTLVVETTNVHPVQGRWSPIPLTTTGKVTERFTRVSEKQIFYEFTVEDPTFYSRPWRAEMSLNAAEGPVYEYACHEGNYSLPGILAGARKEEGR